MENWLVIGSGGREYSIAQKLAEPGNRNVYVAPGNPMMDQIEHVSTVDIDEMDFPGLIDFAQQHDVEWTIVGPERPLSDGIVDAFNAADLHVFGPTKAAAKLESSKAFAKEIMAKQNVATAQYQEYQDAQSAIDYIKDGDFPVVIKANGLAGGKGVIIAQNEADAVDAIEKLFHDRPNSEVLIEEFLKGQEFSLIVMANGTQIVPMPIAQDHKRAFNGDKGPNTGGMGAYSPVPQFGKDVTEQALKEVIWPVLTEMEIEGHPFTGFLYAGLISTKDGIKVIEFNVRMGDPETQVILPQLDADFGDVIQRLMNGGEKVVPKWQSDGYYLGTVLAAKGYPADHKNHLPLPHFDNPQIHVSYAGVANVDGQMVSSGGRIMMVITHADDLKTAQKRVNDEIANNVNADDYEFRTDIGSKAFK